MYISLLLILIFYKLCVWLCVVDNKIRQVRFTSLTRLSSDYLTYLYTCLHTMCSSTNNLFKFGPIYSSIDYCNAHFTHTHCIFLFFYFIGVDKPKTWTRLNQIPWRTLHLYHRWVADCHDNHTQFSILMYVLMESSFIWQSFSSTQYLFILIAHRYIFWNELLQFLLLFFKSYDRDYMNVFLYATYCL